MKSVRKRFAELIRASQLYASAIPNALRAHEVIYQNKERPEPKNLKDVYHNDHKDLPSNPEKPTYLDYKQLNDWNKHNQLLKEIENQKYDTKRVAELGPNLAALHFFTYREAAVKIENHDDWILGNLSTLAAELPHSFLEGVHVEAIDCSHFKRGAIRYEGLQYLAGLDHLRWLSLRNQRYIDVWCLDRIAGTVGTNLQFLDISSCDLNVGSVRALSKLRTLQALVIKYPYHDYNTRVALLHLESESPNLVIKVEKPAIDGNVEKDSETYLVPPITEEPSCKE
ncbi:hypothetical protein NE865_03233 [Phthorimaea operculella]|nr:hypothetical protein NE865_03233 [Phthorimaea operculella]